MRLLINALIIKIFLLHHSSTFASQTETPKAWLISRGNTTAVIVGETHFNTSFEFDPYFKKVIQPLFRNSNIALLEAYRSKSTAMDVAKNLFFPCKLEIDDATKQSQIVKHNVEPGGHKKEVIKEKIPNLIKATIRAGLEVPDWMANWESQEEIALVSVFLPNVGPNIFSSSEEGKKLPAILKEGMSIDLMKLHQREKLKFPILKSLTSMEEYRKTFCTSDADTRQDLVAAAIDSTLGQLWIFEEIKKKGSIELDERIIERDFINVRNASNFGQAFSIRREFDEKWTMTGLVLSTYKGYFRFNFEQQNIAWHKKIVEALNQHNKVYIHVGMLHLANLAFEGKTHPGIIELLRKDGYEVRLIKDVNDIPKNYINKGFWNWLIK